MKKIILKIIDCRKPSEVYFTEVPRFLRKHYFKKLAKNGYLARDMSDMEIDKFATLKIDEEENHIPFIY